MSFPETFNNVTYYSVAFGYNSENSDGTTVFTVTELANPLTLDGSYSAPGQAVTAYFDYNVRGSMVPFTTIQYTTPYYNDTTIEFADHDTMPPGPDVIINTDAEPINVGEQIDFPQPFCFASGSRIRTARGDVAVEALEVGDVAVTASGARRSIKWIGSRTIDALACEQHPIRIRAGAFGDALPKRNLFLSPGHPVLVGDHLVPIMCLINGTSIARTRLERVTYWHVELDQHDILLAEGLPAESYFDMGSRRWFEGDDSALSDPDFVPPGLNGRCRPVAIEGPIVEAERQRVDTIFEATLVDQCAWPALISYWWFAT